MNSIKDKLRDKLIVFQREIIALKQETKKKSNTIDNERKNKSLALIKIIDWIETLEENYTDKHATNEVSGKEPQHDLHSLKRRILGMLTEEHINRIEFDRDRARREFCRIIDTMPHPNKENETILEIVRHGYWDENKKVVLRKADVITVLNDTRKQE